MLFPEWVMLNFLWMCCDGFCGHVGIFFWKGGVLLLMFSPAMM
jgi:hypothetical protein